LLRATELLFLKPSSARIDTFDGFVYEPRIGKLMSENYPVLVSVKAELPKVGADAVLNFMWLKRTPKAANH
jgi:hypothetical protein